jgi:hypothetical protein
LVRPCHWKVHQALDPKAARQSTVDRRFDEGGAKESERDGSADPTLSFAFALGERFSGLVGTGGQFVEPTMSGALGRKVADCSAEGLTGSSIVGYITGAERAEN